jgi:hypothetical protein
MKCFKIEKAPSLTGEWCFFNFKNKSKMTVYILHSRIPVAVSESHSPPETKTTPTYSWGS